MARRRGSGSVRGGALALVLAAIALSPRAYADASPAEIAAARQLFKEGKDLETQSAWGDALAKFKTVGQVKMTPQVRFHIGLCEENLGKLVSAINDFELAAEDAKKPDANAPEVVENAASHAEALRQRVPKIRLALKGKLKTSRLLLDGERVARALVGTAIPADPGAHKVDLKSASGKSLFHRDLDLKERATEDVEIPVDPNAEEPLADDDDEAPPPPVPASKPKEKEVTTGSRAPAVVAGVVGGLSLIGAGVFFGMEQSSISDLEANCPTHKNCSPLLQSEFNSGHTDGTVSAVLLGVGIAGLATAGVLWFVLAPTTKPAPSQGGRALLESVRVAPTPSGAVVRGAF